MNKILKLTILNIPVIIACSLLSQFFAQVDCRTYIGGCSGNMFTLAGTIQFSIMASFFLTPLLLIESLFMLFLVKNKVMKANLLEWQQTTKIFAYLNVILVASIGLGYLWSLISGALY